MQSLVKIVLGINLWPPLNHQATYAIIIIIIIIINTGQTAQLMVPRGLDWFQSIKTMNAVFGNYKQLQVND